MASSVNRGRITDASFHLGDSALVAKKPGIIHEAIGDTSIAGAVNLSVQIEGPFQMPIRSVVDSQPPT